MSGFPFFLVPKAFGDESPQDPSLGFNTALLGETDG